MKASRNFRRNSSSSRVSWVVSWGARKLLAGAGIALLAGGVVTYLWNAILPEALGVRPLTFLQGVGLLILSRLLFYTGGVAAAPRREIKAQMGPGPLTGEDRAAFLSRIRQRLAEAERDETPSEDC
jgi:hypothetical protein